VQEGFCPDARVLPEAPRLTPTLKDHFAYLQSALAEARAAPLSQRRTLLVVLLADALVERLFEAWRDGPDDVLAFRAALALRHPALGLIHEIALQRESGPRLVTEAVEVPLEDYPALGIADFMVSLYNQRTVQRVRVALPDGGRRDAHELIAEAAAALSAESAVPGLNR
jgi:hypothetical protein